MGHPAHVHYFKNFIRIMESKGHKFLITARNREFIGDLLKKENIKYRGRGKGARSTIGRIFYTFKADLILLWHALKFKPDLYLSHCSPYSSHIAWILRKPCIFTNDTDSSNFSRYYIPFISALISPSCFKYNYGKKHVCIDSYMELMHLHPHYFNPNGKNVKSPFPNNNKKNVLIRLVSYKAHHERKKSGIPPKVLKELITKLEPHCNVLISSENKLEDSLSRFKLVLKPHLIHHFLASIDFIISEGATMTSESAVLGTPALYYDSVGLCYTDQQEKEYNLVWNFKSPKGMVERALELAQTDNLKETIKSNRNKLISEKIDLTAFLVWFVENYPNSHKTMLQNPEYQNRFRM